jgi:spectinomycin phosphotransferase
MLVPHPRVNHAELRDFIAMNYESGDAELEFQPLGEDSWSYRFGSLWVSVRRDIQGHVPSAYRAAYELAQEGCEFVVAPLTGSNGQVVQVFRGSPVVVFPYLSLAPFDSGAATDRLAAKEILRMVGAVHATLVKTDLPREDFRFPFSEQLTHSLAVALESDLRSGPYSAKLHRLIRQHATSIATLLKEAEQLSRRCSRAPGTFVLTHGEPSTGNVLRFGERLVLVDWGALALGPAERDLFHIHRTFGLHIAGRTKFLRFYELRWILGEIAEYVSHFLSPHQGNCDDDAMWHRLLRYVPQSKRNEPLAEAK